MKYDSKKNYKQYENCFKMTPSCTDEVFVQHLCISCYCGLQGAVVESRVRDFNRGDLQEHMLGVFGGVRRHA